MRITLVSSIAIAAACCALAASAQTVYKLIDRNGKITYSEEKPKNFDGEVIQIDIDPNANRATMPKGTADEAAAMRKQAADDKQRKAAAAKKGDLDDALLKLDDARKALKEAQDHPSDDDVQYFGNKTGGVRVVPSDSYQKKIAKLTDDVKRAEDAVRNAGGTP